MRHAHSLGYTYKFDIKHDIYNDTFNVYDHICKICHMFIVTVQVTKACFLYNHFHMCDNEGVCSELKESPKCM